MAFPGKLSPTNLYEMSHRKTSLRSLELYVLTRRINHLEKNILTIEVSARDFLHIFWKIIERGSLEWHNKGSMTFARELQHFFERRKSPQWNAPLKRKIIFHLLHPHISLVYLLKLKPQSGPLDKKWRNKMIFYES